MCPLKCRIIIYMCPLYVASPSTCVPYMSHHHLYVSLICHIIIYMQLVSRVTSWDIYRDACIYVHIRTHITTRERESARARERGSEGGREGGGGGRERERETFDSAAPLNLLKSSVRWFTSWQRGKKGKKGGKRETKFRSSISSYAHTQTRVRIYTHAYRGMPAQSPSTHTYTHTHTRVRMHASTQIWTQKHTTETYDSSISFSPLAQTLSEKP